MAARRRKTPKIYYAKTKNRTSKKIIVRRGMVILLLTATSVALLAGAFAGLKYTGSLFFSRNPKFELKTINITSDGRLPPEFFCERAGLQVGTNLFSLDLDKLRQKLEEVPLVESVTIDRRLPDTLIINITERVAMSQIRWNPRALPFLVDRFGVILPMTRSGQSLPLIEGLKLQNLRPGDRVENPGIRQCLDILAAADQLGLGSQVAFSSFDTRYPDFVTAIVNNDVTVRFPLHSGRERLIRLVSVLQLSNEQGRRVKTIDLTPDGRNVPVTFYEPEKTDNPEPSGATRK
ncbi:MAG TPA: FtsQ-type POTRA domain-containing protein [Pontiellaceae bacterium]|nr:FtsQ-type POTRA domain-containing protein [Pontiellaceae bacterium]